MDKKSFKQFAFKPEIEQVINQLYFKRPTEIQRQVIPEILKGKSVIGQSQTGTGKTHAYLLPIFQQIEPSHNNVQFVITAPTRELAMQIFDEVKTIIKLADKEQIWTARLLVGGMDRLRMIKQLKNPPQIIVGTPGRILDMVNEQALSIYSAKSFVVDEADLMLDLGFIHEVDQLLVRCKKDIQTVVFSATIPQQLEYFLKKYLINPVHIKVENGLVPETMEHRLIALRHRSLAEIISNISKVIQPYVALIFTNSKEKADELANELREIGLEIGIIHGGLSARERKQMVRDIRELRYPYIIATDLASRGIDIKGVSHVINAELPKEVDFYIHRVGRTARAGMEGQAISLYIDDDIKIIEQLENKGVTFTYCDIKQGEWVESKPWNKRNKRKDALTSIEKEAWKRVRKPKQIKPGYKKKMRQQQKSIKRQLMKKRNKK